MSNSSIARKDRSREEFLALAEDVYDKYQQASGKPIPKFERVEVDGFDNTVIELLKDVPAESFIEKMRTHDFTKMPATQIAQVLDVLDTKIEEMIDAQFAGMDKSKELFEEAVKIWDQCMQSLPPEVRADVDRKIGARERSGPTFD